MQILIDGKPIPADRVEVVWGNVNLEDDEERIEGALLHYILLPDRVETKITHKGEIIRQVETSLTDIALELFCYS